MTWLVVIVVVVVIGYYVLKAVGNHYYNQDKQWLENRLDTQKIKIIEHHTNQIAELRAGNNIILTSKKEIAEKIAELQGEIEIVRLWDRHYKTVMASDQYSGEAKTQLKNAWFDYLVNYDRLVTEIEVGFGDPFETVKVLRETRETLIAKLEAFGYDGDKEYKDIENKLKPRPNKARKVA